MGGGSGATAVATISAGAVSAIYLTSVGTGYLSVPTVMLSGGGSGATATASITNAYTGTVTDPFPPNLDFIGNKQHTGVCFVCHGGQPQTLTSTGAYPNQGRVGGFRMLPLNVRNLLFTSDLEG